MYSSASLLELTASKSKDHTQYIYIYKYIESII